MKNKDNKFLFTAFIVASCLAVLPGKEVCLAQIKITGVGATSTQSYNITNSADLVTLTTGAGVMKLNTNVFFFGSSYSTLADAITASTGKILWLPDGTFTSQSLSTLTAPTRILDFRHDRLDFYGVQSWGYKSWIKADSLYSVKSLRDTLDVGGSIQLAAGTYTVTDSINISKSLRLSGSGSVREPRMKLNPSATKVVFQDSLIGTIFKSTNTAGANTIHSNARGQSLQDFVVIGTRTNGDGVLVGVDNGSGLDSTTNGLTYIRNIQSVNNGKSGFHWWSPDNGMEGSQLYSSTNKQYGFRVDKKPDLPQSFSGINLGVDHARSRNNGFGGWLVKDMHHSTFKNCGAIADSGVGFWLDGGHSAVTINFDAEQTIQKAGGFPNSTVRISDSDGTDAYRWWTDINGFYGVTGTKRRISMENVSSSLLMNTQLADVNEAGGDSGIVAETDADIHILAIGDVGGASTTWNPVDNVIGRQTISGLLADPGSNTTTLVESSLTSSANGAYVGWRVTEYNRTTGASINTSTITAYVGSTKIATMSPAITGFTTNDSVSVDNQANAFVGQVLLSGTVTNGDMWVETNRDLLVKAVDTTKVVGVAGLSLQPWADSRVDFFVNTPANINRFVRVYGDSTGSGGKKYGALNVEANGDFALTSESNLIIARSPFAIGSSQYLRFTEATGIGPTPSSSTFKMVVKSDGDPWTKNDSGDSTNLHKTFNLGDTVGVVLTAPGAAAVLRNTMNLVLDTFGTAVLDTLVSLSGKTGDVVIIGTRNSSRDLFIADGATFQMSGDMTLSDVQDQICFKAVSANVWRQQYFSNNN